MRRLQAGEAEQSLRTVVDPKSYFQWLGILQSEVGNFSKEKWRDALKSINPPERMGSEDQFESERWYAALAMRPSATSDVWDYVRNWKEFQKYLMAATSILKSPLLEGRLAALRVPSSRLSMGEVRSMYSKSLDKRAKQAHREGMRGVAHNLCVLRDRWAAIETMVRQADDWFMTQVIDKMTDEEWRRYSEVVMPSQIQMQERHLAEYKAKLEDPKTTPEERRMAEERIKMLPAAIEKTRSDLERAKARRSEVRS